MIYKLYTYFFLLDLLSIGENLDFNDLAIAINMGMQISLWDPYVIVLDIDSEVGLLDDVIILF